MQCAQPRRMGFKPGRVVDQQSDAGRPVPEQQAVQRVASAYLHEDQRTVGWFVPRNNGQDA